MVRADHDVVIIGGGVMGAAVFDQLADAGRRVLLVDGGDFAGGTSQASAMLIWGGLLYAANGDWGEIARLSGGTRGLAPAAGRVGRAARRVVRVRAEPPPQPAGDPRRAVGVLGAERRAAASTAG